MFKERTARDKNLKIDSRIGDSIYSGGNVNEVKEAKTNKTKNNKTKKKQE